MRENHVVTTLGHFLIEGDWTAFVRVRMIQPDGGALPRTGELRHLEDGVRRRIAAKGSVGAAASPRAAWRPGRRRRCGRGKDGSRCVSRRGVRGALAIFSWSLRSATTKRRAFAAFSSASRVSSRAVLPDIASWI